MAGPYLITKRFSDLNYQFHIKPGKFTTVNVNRMKKFQTPRQDKRQEGLSHPWKRLFRRWLEWQWQWTSPFTRTTQTNPLSPGRDPKFGKQQCRRDTCQWRTDTNSCRDSYGPFPKRTKWRELPSGNNRNYWYKPDTRTYGRRNNNYEDQPSAYSLRPLPGRWNYNSTESINDWPWTYRFRLRTRTNPRLEQGLNLLVPTGLDCDGQLLEHRRQLRF